MLDERGGFHRLPLPDGRRAPMVLAAQPSPGELKRIRRRRFARLTAAQQATRLLNALVVFAFVVGVSILAGVGVGAVFDRNGWGP